MTPFIVMDVLERAHEKERQGVHIIHLEVGEPDFDTPRCIKEAACKALDDGHTHYTHSLGMIELREAISEHYFKKYRVSVDPGQLVISSGTSPAMFVMFAALLEKGDQVIISDPHYACYPNFIKFVQGEPVTIPVYEEDGFQYRPEAIEEKITNKTKAIFINSPSNPTGNLLSANRMKAIAGLSIKPDSPYVISWHIESLVLFICKSAGMTPLPYGHFLYPTDRIEAPSFQVGGDRFFDPTDIASAVFLTPKTDVLWIAHCGWIDVIDAKREKRLAFRGNQPPVALPLAQSEEAVRLDLGRGNGRSSLGIK